MHFAELDQGRVDLAPVQRGPRAVGGASHPVGDDDVLVRLGVAVPGVVMVEHETGHPVASHGRDPSLPGAGCCIAFPLHVFEGHPGGLLQAFLDARAGFLVAERPQDADAFGLAGRQIPSGDGRLVHVAADEVHVAQVLAVCRVAALVDQAAHLTAGRRLADRAADQVGGRSDPHAGRVAFGRVVGGRVRPGQGRVRFGGLLDVPERVFGVAEFRQVQCHGLFSFVP